MPTDFDQKSSATNSLLIRHLARYLRLILRSDFERDHAQTTPSILQTCIGRTDDIAVYFSPLRRSIDNLRFPPVKRRIESRARAIGRCGPIPAAKVDRRYAAGLPKSTSTKSRPHGPSDIVIRTLRIEYGKTYEASFEAKADKPFNLISQVQLGKEPWTSYSKQRSFLAW
jgi:hypothetical protein